MLLSQKINLQTIGSEAKGRDEPSGSRVQSKLGNAAKLRNGIKTIKYKDKKVWEAVGKLG